VRPAWADIDLGAVTHNVTVLRDLVAPARVCAVVKAQGYGHGAVEVARAALAGGADRLAVALAAEGSELRDAGLHGPIIVLSQASPDELDDLVRHDLDATVYTAAGVQELAAAAASRSPRQPIAVHLKVDTGMHRVGAQPAEVVGLAQAVIARPELRLASVFTHCAVADEPDNPFTDVQLRRYQDVLDDLAQAGVDVAMRHAANTAAAIAHPASRYDLVRIGIGMYGLPPSPALSGRVGLRPAMSLKARVSHVKRVAAGEGLSYGLRYHPATDANIATVPLGYADGVARRLGSTGAQVLIGGRRFPVAGTVTMDQLLVDCGDRPVQVGEEVVLIGRQGDEEITADEWADRLGTINYEVVCGVSLRVPRCYH
jgi:alanine racemase